jgi:hypothetical protein
MGYGALTAFLKPRPDAKRVALLAYAEISRALNEGTLLALLEREAETIGALMEKVDEADDLRRQIKNLEWNLNRIKGKSDGD